MLFPPKHFVVENGLLVMQAGSLTKPTIFVVWDDTYEENFRLIQGRYRIGRVCLNHGTITLSPSITGADLQHLRLCKPVATLTRYEAKLFNSMKPRKFYALP
jgi:hypothetical protein